LGWRVYAESMPSACYAEDSGLYVVRHNPAPYYRKIVDSCPTHDVPLPATLPSQLPPLSFVIPNQCSNMHDCPVATGDSWLATWVPRFLATGAIVVVTFDEGTTNIGGGGHVFTAVVGAAIRADSGSYNHYSLLAALQDRYGVARTGNAVEATPLPIEVAGPCEATG